MAFGEFVAALIVEPIVLVVVLVLLPFLLVVVACCQCYCCCNQGRSLRKCCLGPDAVEGRLNCADDFLCCVPKCKDSCCCVGPKTEPDRKLTQKLTIGLAIATIIFSAFSIAGAIEADGVTDYIYGWCGTDSFSHYWNDDYGYDYDDDDDWYGSSDYDGSGSASGKLGKPITLEAPWFDWYNFEDAGPIIEPWFMRDLDRESQLETTSSPEFDAIASMSVYNDDYNYDDDDSNGKVVIDAAGLVLHVVVVMMMLITLWNVRSSRKPTRRGMGVSLLATSISLISLLVATTLSVSVSSYLYFSAYWSVGWLFAFFSAYVFMPLLLFTESRLFRGAASDTNLYSGRCVAGRCGGRCSIDTNKIANYAPTDADSKEVPPTYSLGQEEKDVTNSEALPPLSLLSTPVYITIPSSTNV